MVKLVIGARMVVTCLSWIMKTVSAMKTLLTSTCLRRILPIQGNTHQEQWQIEAIVVGWELRTRQDPDKAVRSDGYNHENGIECPLIGQKSIADCITMSARKS